MTTRESAAGKAPNFDRLARLYRWMEAFSFGPFLWRCRTAFLPELTNCRRALILGDGDGRFTARLLRENPEITVLAVDASPAMLASLRRRCAAHASRLTIQIADLRAWHPPAAPLSDLIVTHFFLDCLTSGEVQTLAAKLSPVLSPGALWVVSEFAIPASLFGRLIARPVIAMLYWAFGWLTGLRIRALPNYSAALGSIGFSLSQRRTLLCGLLVSELWTKKH
jgi:SAM-dependent methyltransferase